MSYILDALRRAESERDRGQVPGLHAQATPVGLGEGEGPRLPSVVWMAAGGMVFAAALVLLGWWLSRPTTPETPAGVAMQPAGQGAPVAPALPTEAAGSAGAATPMPSAVSLGGGQTSPTAPAMAGAAPPLLVAPPVPARAPATELAPAAPPPGRAQPRTPSNPATVASVTSIDQPANAANRVAPTAVAPAAATPPTAPSLPNAAAKPIPLAELPAAQSAELPQLQIGGAIYSDQPASRFVVINGLVVREGETAAPGVVLERIAPKSAVIRWRDMKIELPI